MKGKQMTQAVLRVEKLKTLQNVASSLAHTHRSRATPNADPQRRGDNEHDRTEAETMNALRELLPEKRRKDAVICLEYLITANKNWDGWQDANQGEKFLNDTRKWLEEKHGAENVIGVSIHRDEQAPHLIAYVVPIDERGKLNAKAFTGGRETLRKMQTDFYENVAKDVGLERGNEGSTAEHKTVKEFYSELPKKEAEIQAQKEELEMAEFEMKMEAGIAANLAKAELDNKARRLREEEEKKRLELDERERVIAEKEKGLQARIDAWLADAKAYIQALFADIDFYRQEREKRMEKIRERKEELEANMRVPSMPGPR
jgi:hypothetical protein